MAIKVLRENTSPKANKEILDVSPSTLYRRDPPGCWSGLWAFSSLGFEETMLSLNLNS